MADKFKRAVRERMARTGERYTTARNALLMERFNAEVRRDEVKEHAARAKGLVPAIPPNDYKGTQADWMRGLMERGLWDGNGFHGDRWISPNAYEELLVSCES